jgi:hypothetical protein
MYILLPHSLCQQPKQKKANKPQFFSSFGEEPRAKLGTLCSMGDVSYTRALALALIGEKTGGNLASNKQGRRGQFGGISGTKPRQTPSVIGNGRVTRRREVVIVLMH